MTPIKESLAAAVTGCATMLVVALFGSGCVSQSTFDALKTERDGLDTTLGEKNKALAELEAKQNKLSAKNAELDAALEAGLPAERISAASFGETRPIASNESRETKGQNRRIELIIVSDLSQLPGFEELKALDAKQ